jgi:hypothetical protein
MATGAWKKQRNKEVRVPLQAPIDPDHSNPENQAQVLWNDTTGAPSLPVDVEGGQFEQGNVVGGPLDMTPQDHDFGYGVEPGFTTEQAQAVRGYAGELDYGSVAQRLYAAPEDRDGHYDVSVVSNHPLDGTSPETVDIRWNTGVGSPNDSLYGGQSHPNKRIQRWRDRYIDMHWWGVDMNPSVARHSRGTAVLPEVANRNQYVSDEEGHVILHPDNWEVPQERRTPRAWDESMTVDGSEQPDSFGLGNWGL